MRPCSRARQGRRPQLRSSLRPPWADCGRDLRTACRWMRPCSPAREGPHRQGQRPERWRSVLPRADPGRDLQGVAAGCGLAAVLGSDGTAEACGQSCAGQCYLPALIEDGICMQFSLLLDAGGHSCARATVPPCCHTCEGRCDVAAMILDVVYMQSLMDASSSPGQRQCRRCLRMAWRAPSSRTQFASGCGHAVLLLRGTSACSPTCERCGRRGRPLGCARRPVSRLGLEDCPRWALAFQSRPRGGDSGLTYDGPRMARGGRALRFLRPFASPGLFRAGP